MQNLRRENFYSREIIIKSSKVVDKREEENVYK